MFILSSLQNFSDVGIRWNGGDISARELILQMKRQEWPVVYLLTHPDYWSKSFFRACGLQVAARGMRLFKLNQMVIVGKQAYNLHRRLVGSVRRFFN